MESTLIKNFRGNIFNSFINNVSYMVILPIRWDKFGVIVRTVYNILRPTNTKDRETCSHHNPENVFVITGISDSKWRKHTKNHLPQEWRDNMYYRKNNRMRTVTNALIVIDEYNRKKNVYIITKKLKEWFNLTNIQGLTERNNQIIQLHTHRHNINSRITQTQL